MLHQRKPMKKLFDISNPQFFISTVLLMISARLVWFESVDRTAAGMDFVWETFLVVDIVQCSS